MDENPGVARLIRILPEVARTAAPGAVHKLRTSVRRLQAAGGELGKRWDRLRRLAGEVRDLDVQAGLLRHLHLASDGGRAQMLAGMEAERELRAEKLRRHLSPKKRERLRERLRRAAAPAGATAAGEMRGEFEEMDRRFPSLDTGNLHAFRKECKRLRYRAEAAGGAELARAFEQMQDSIGAWHDWRQLAERAQREAGTEPTLRAALDNAAAAHYVGSLRTCAVTRAGLRARAATGKAPGTAPAARRTALRATA